MADTKNTGAGAPEQSIEELLAQLAEANKAKEAAEKEAAAQKKAATAAKKEAKEAIEAAEEAEGKLKAVEGEAPTPENLEVYLRQKVPYRIPLVNKDDPDVFVSVNGESYQIQRGVEVKVPRFIAIHLDNQRTADEEILRMQKALTAKTEAAARELTR